MSDLARRLAEMFEADPPEDWFDRWPSWEEGLAMKPWWPPLSAVWLYQGQCPDPPDGSMSKDPGSWAEVWALLRRLHAEYLEAKKRG